MTPEKLLEALKNKAIKILSFREHSSKELARKLNQMDGGKIEKNLINQVILELTQRDYLSDKRYAEVLIRSRARKGYGPNYCKNALLQAGVSHEIIDQAMQDFELNSEFNWPEIKQKLIEKKTKNLNLKDSKISPKTSPKEAVKLKRFLQGRGF